MLDSFLKIIEKGIELVNLKQRNDKENFESFVVPLFDEFSLVVAEYFRLFGEGGIDTEKAINIRNGYIQSRIKVTELAKFMKTQVKDPGLVEFYNLIATYFHGDFVFPESISQSNGRYYIEIISGKRTFSQSYKAPKSLVEMRDDLENRWERVVRVYGALKFKYCLPIGYKA